MTETTLLRLDPISVPPYSARGINESFDLDGTSQLARTVNTELIDLADASENDSKYKLTITCTDQNMPALDGVKRGMTLTVDCATEFTYLTSSGSPSRPPASTTDDPATRTEGDYTFYRPRLTMKVVDYRLSFDEPRADNNWSLILLEV
ncbi:MAG: hypothetical protein EOS73_26305 [Mesorhizobium sp.]|uniref:hypothetical protein n=1 Tax=Mesorhizobium sp. M7A.F.Ca.ET.027.02.1.1 TaxID=2496655 RepID=UPI000FD5B554|nr:hypothetical protein [Mesorhizobium sp. M7A.F.Ca.ET.027.02.1.1]RVD13024.1 hypothetical protein EN749_25160 [Mesorhizobium sp. M7A.F.Ca.ET.027.02.1.1]RWC99959.1 MAG: hypothetical protein EOS73_26305 [Mesorhizobium sp.]